MFERYTEKARRVIFFARYEASQFGSPYIETEHLLLGLLREDNPMVSRHLPSPGYEESILKQIKSQTAIRDKIATSVDLPLSNECKRVLAYAAEESMRLGHNHIGTEHLLLGLLRETGCFAERMLSKRGADLKRLREELSEGPRQNFAAQSPPLPAHLFERFSQKLTSAIIFAMYEASRFGSPAIETEHLLLGLVHEDKPTLDRLLDSEVTEDSIREEIEANGPVQRPGPMNLANMPLTDEGKRAISCAVGEAGSLGHKAVGPEHLLLGLLYEESCFAAKMLLERGADLVEIRKKLSDIPPAA
jgi:ATP-dependent Clp protease ATP-binding subunit ClpA